MDRLRFILLILGVLFIFGVYAWEMYRRRRGRPRRPNRRLEGDPAQHEPVGAGSAVRQRDTEPLTDELLTGLDDIVPDRDVPVGDLPGLASADPSERPAASRSTGARGEEASIARAPERARVAPQLTREEAPGAEPGPVVALTVMARNDNRFSGARLLEALENAGMASGEGRIYHRYPGSKTAAKAPLFSAANVLKPGTLGRDELPGLKTKGVALFMQCGSGRDDRAAFELMLNTGRQLAAELDGEVCDQSRTALTAEAIGSLRQTVAESHV